MSNTLIDLRSDTVTQPSADMRDAMAQATLGDDVYGEDPTVNELEAYAAELTGKQAALFGVSGTQTNLLGILAHCQRGHEYIVGATAHTYQYEGGGAAVLGGVQPCTIPFNARGELPLSEIEKVIKPDDYHFAMTRLLCLENTQGGKVLSMDYLKDWQLLAEKHGLRRHLDGARAFNAAVALNVPIQEICAPFDTVSLCLSKGLGAPVGSLLVGDEDVIRQARRWRKMIGGGMRQAGVIASAGLYALKSNVKRLSQDHEKARVVASEIDQHDTLKLLETSETNMVMLDPGCVTKAFIKYLKDKGIRTSGPRWVFHLDVNDDDIDQIIAAIRQYP